LLEQDAGHLRAVSPVESEGEGKAERKRRLMGWAIRKSWMREKRRGAKEKEKG
jgi:hypothetical protein